jgi:superfamily II DNA or RNA helicase
VQLFEETADFLLKGLSGIVSAHTGWGKTVLGYHAAATVQRKTLVITTKDDIYQQWLTGAQTFLGLKSHEIGEIRGDKCEVVGTKFVVAMIHSLSKDGKYPEWITKDFGLVIFDEVHRCPAEQFSEVVDMFPALLRLGLSATTERADGKELLIYAHIGPIRAKTEVQLMVPKVLRFKSAWECPRVLRMDEETGEKKVVRLPHEPGKTTHIEKMIAADSVRNHLIGELIESAFAKGRKTVVFSTLHDHLKSLHRVCREAYGISGRQMGFYIGATTKGEKESREREKVKPILFTTYAMMSEGTDIPWLDTCVIAMPRSSVTQPVGRIRREYPDKGTPVVMDVCDYDSPVFSGYANSRIRWYASIDAIVKDM